MQKQALITGATSGIGRATALRLAKEGYAVIATGRRADRLATLRAEIEAAGGRCTTLAFDVRSEEEVRRNLSPLENIDLLVNNAGLAAGLEHIDLGDTRDWDAMIDTNVKGLLYVTRVIAPKMVAAGRGHIFNIGSIAGNGRDRIFRSAFPRRQEARRRGLRRRRTAHRRRHCGSNRMGGTITRPYER